ncbi:SCO6745 family protein [Ilumatobacter sp.]|uniref:SCO6745 family protein n=1 Tax=Ilumatobacter sp. TaxID=1967498 RepID=UPI003C41F16C
MEPMIGRRTWKTMEAYHGAIYFVAEAGEEYSRVGVGDWMAGYFGSRSAAMGAVGADVVIATFFNFDHDLVRRSMDGLWDAVTPERLIEARMAAVDRMLTTHVLPIVDPSDLARAVELARAAADVASARPEGRPLFAGHAAQPWPDDDHLALWHAQTLLREYRGDGHIAALVGAGLDGCEALVTHGASGDVPAAVLQATRRRSDEDWAAAVESLRSRGWLDADGALTETGREERRSIEETTDRLAHDPYAAIGEEACAELRGLVRPWSAALAGTFPTR